MSNFVEKFLVLAIIVVSVVLFLVGLGYVNTDARKSQGILLIIIALILFFAAAHRVWTKMDCQEVEDIYVDEPRFTGRYHGGRW